MNRLARSNFGLDRFSGIYLWIVFIVMFTIWTPLFFTTSTLHVIASGQAITGIISLAVLVALVAGQFDLSVGANANFVGILAIIVQLDWHWPVYGAVLFSIAIGAAIGFVNGLVVVKLRVNSFIATLGMGSILSAFQVIITANQQPAPVLTLSWNTLTQRTIGGFQIVFLYVLVLGVLLWWVLDHTPLGRYLYAIGGNSDAARLSGIRVDRFSWLSLVMSGAIAGLGGVFYASLSGPSLTFGPTLLLPAFAAAYLGSTQLQPGRFNVWGTLIAIYVLATGVQGLQLVSGQEWLSDMFNGVALIIAVALSVSRRRGVTNRAIRRRQRRARAEPVSAGSPAENESAPVEVQKE